MIVGRSGHSPAAMAGTAIPVAAAADRCDPCQSHRKPQKLGSATDCSGVFLWNTTKSSEPRVVNLRIAETKVRKKPPQKARVLIVRESTISGRLQLPVYLYRWRKSNIIMPDHLYPHLRTSCRAARRRRGLSGKLWRAACGRIAQPSQNTV